MKKFYLVIVTISLEIFFVIMFFRPITAINEDLGRHLLFGQITLTQNYIPKVNLISYTNPTFPFINASWLSEVIFFWLVKVGGFNLLLLVSTIIVTSSFWIQIYFSSKRYSVISILSVIPIYILLLSFRADVRPEIFSMLFMSIFMVVLYSAQEKPGKKIYSLILLEILWANMHIYFFVGPVLVGLFLTDNLWKNKFHFHQNTKPFLLTFLGTIVAVLINPNGIRGALFPITVLFNYGFPIRENQSIISLFNLYGQTVVLLPVFSFVILYFLLIKGRKNTRLIDWLLATTFSIVTIIIFRNVLLFVFATLVLFIKQFDFFIKKYLPKVERAIPSQQMFFKLSLCLFLLILIQANIISSTGSELVDDGKGMTDFLIKNNIKGPLLNNFNIGGYLSYRLYPQLVYVDNRPEAFPKSFFENIYIPMQDNPAVFEAEDKKYHFNVLVLSHWDGTPGDDKILNYFVNSSNFKPVYLDSYAIILIRETAGNRLFISQHEITKETIDVSTFNDPQTLISYLFFFEKIGWIDKEEEIFVRLKKLDPKLQILAQYPLPGHTSQTLIQKLN